MFFYDNEKGGKNFMWFKVLIEFLYSFAVLDDFPYGCADSNRPNSPLLRVIPQKEKVTKGF